jgi:hypothetical protein
MDDKLTPPTQVSFPVQSIPGAAVDGMSDIPESPSHPTAGW